MANTYFGNHIGICINNNDPERRGRVQIFVPHIMPTLYEGWNKDGNDINITCVGSNLQNGLTNDQITKLRQILPWAEAASPVCGGSAPGNLIERTTSAVQGALTSVGNAISNTFSFDQTPTAVPVLNSEAVSISEQNANIHQSSISGVISTESDNATSGGPDPTITNTTPPNTNAYQDLSNINPNMLKYLATIAQGETELSYNEAYKNTYNNITNNPKTNNANVQRGVEKEGLTLAQAQAKYGDYGYYQVNGEQVVKASSLGISNLNSGTASQQTLAMAQYIEKVYPKQYQQIINGDFSSANQALGGVWFGIGRVGGTAYTNSVDPNSFISAVQNADKNPLGNPATISTTQSGTNLVNKTNPHGAIATQNLNNTAKGLFTYPAAGAMLWVFFREGNPLYPVYFAASYSNDEWKSAYRYQSPVDGYSNNENGISSTKTFLNLQGGGISTHSTHCPDDPTKNQQSLMLFGPQGSNITLHDDHDQYFSKFGRRDQVEGDRWNTTLGYKEDWIQGDHNHVTMGDVYVKIGNVSQPAVDAVARIQQLIKDGHKPLTDLK
jgi:hypothetical protein